MKYLVIYFSLFFSSYCFSEHWFEQWEQGMQFEQKENFSAAIDAYTKALEIGCFEDNFHVLYDRAMCFMMIENYAHALKDLDIFLEKSDLCIADKLKALRLKGSALLFLGREREYRSLYEESNAMDCNLPILEKYQNTVVVRNVPSCKCTQKAMEKIYVKMNFCESTDKIRKFNDVWLMYRKPCEKCNESCNPQKKRL